jgi:ubiquitin-small subunit ribosomal protein S27Ae
MGKKKEKPKAHPSQVWKCYDASSGLKQKNKACPKCGAGTFMAQHKERNYCGKCHYTEFQSKKA